MAADEEPSLLPPLTTGAMDEKQTKTSRTSSSNLIAQQSGIEEFLVCDFVCYTLLIGDGPLVHREISQRFEGARAALDRRIPRS